MTTVYLIRHAEAEGNLYRRMHGHYDAALTELGIRQLDALEKRFEGIHIDKVYTSDLKRAVQTSEAITRSRNIETVKTPRLREVNMGIWEDREWGYAAEFYPEQLAFFNSDPFIWHVDGSERFSDLQDRMLSAIICFAAENDGKTIALFSHAVAIKAVTSKLMGLESDRISALPYCGNTGVMELAVSGDDVNIVKKSDSDHITKEYTHFHRKIWEKPKSGFDPRNLYLPYAEIPEDLELIKSWCGSNVPDGLENRDFRDTAIAVCGGEKIGAVSVDTETYDGIGLIDVYYLVPEWRGHFFSPQLLGKAVTRCRELGFTAVRMELEPDNDADIGLKCFGFREVGHHEEKRVFVKDI